MDNTRSTTPDDSAWGSFPDTFEFSFSPQYRFYTRLEPYTFTFPRETFDMKTIDGTDEHVLFETPGKR